MTIKKSTKKLSLFSKFKKIISKIGKLRKHKAILGVWAFSLLNGVICFWLFFASQSLYYLSGYDAGILHRINSLTDLVFDDKKDSLQYDLLLINTSYDNSLVDYKVDSVPMGNIPVTDRKKLANFLLKLKQLQSHKYVICDVFFEISSPDDSLLLNALRQPNLVTAVRNNGNRFIFEGKGVKTGFADITTSSNTFYKYSMFPSDVRGKSIPLVVFEDCTGQRVSKGIFWNYHNGNRLLNDFIPELTYTNYNISNLPIDNLGDVISLPPTFFNSTVKDKFIIIGDFYERDKILTSIGKVQGPLVLLNTVIALANGRNRISISLIVTLILIFTIFSYFLLKPTIKIARNNNLKPINIGSLLFNSFLFFACISYGIFWIFGIKMVFAWTALFLATEYLVINFKIIKKEKLDQFWKLFSNIRSLYNLIIRNLIRLNYLHLIFKNRN